MDNKNEKITLPENLQIEILKFFINCKKKYKRNLSKQLDKDDNNEKQ